MSSPTWKHIGGRECILSIPMIIVHLDRQSAVDLRIIQWVGMVQNPGDLQGHHSCMWIIN